MSILCPQIGSVNPALSCSDLATRAYMVAAIFAMAMEIQRTITLASQDNVIEDLPALFNDLRIRLDDNFTLTREQKENIRSITQDIIYTANHTAFKTLHLEVEVTLRNEQGQLRLSNIFGNPSRERVLMTHLRRTCSSVRNAFRQDIRDSISGDHPLTLYDFSFDSAVKYKRGGPGATIVDSIIIHNAILRCFALDHPELLNIEENDDGSGTTTTDSMDGPAHKKQKTSSAGRVSRGQDFWSHVDAFFVATIGQYGRDLAGQLWLPYVNDIAKRDEQLFPPFKPMAQTNPAVTVPSTSGIHSAADLANILN